MLLDANAVFWRDSRGEIVADRRDQAVVDVQPKRRDLEPGVHAGERGPHRGDPPIVVPERGAAWRRMAGLLAATVIVPLRDRPVNAVRLATAREASSDAPRGPLTENS